MLPLGHLVSLSMRQGMKTRCARARLLVPGSLAQPLAPRIVVLSAMNQRLWTLEVVSPGEWSAGEDVRDPGWLRWFFSPSGGRWRLQLCNRADSKHQPSGLSRATNNRSPPSWNTAAVRP